MLRVRLKADGRIVEVLADGSERVMVPTAVAPANGDHSFSARLGALAPSKLNGSSDKDTAAYARRVRAATRLSQNDFAARIGVPVETVRNWEQGKRAPRGPARSLLKIVDRAPGTAFAVLAGPSGTS